MKRAIAIVLTVGLALNLFFGITSASAADLNSNAMGSFISDWIGK